GTLGGSVSNAFGINDLGEVVGFSAIGEIGRHAAWWYSGLRRDLGSLGGSSQAFAINNLGEAVGVSDLAGSIHEHAFANVNGAVLDLGTLGGPNSRAMGINDHGEAVGWSNGSDRYQKAFVYDLGLGPNAAIIPLGTLGGRVSRAYDINERHQVVGWSDTGFGEHHAFLLDLAAGGPMQDLGTLAGGLSEAFAVNDQGIAVGTAYQVTGPGPIDREWRPVRYDPNDPVGVTELVAAAGAARDINLQGEIVGEFRVPTARQGTHGFLYDAQGGFHDLNDLVLPGSNLEVTGAWGINDQGQIAAVGTFPNPVFGMWVEHAVLLTPVPEPGSWLLTASAALLGLALRRPAAAA
ncbi:MAG: DUF3466 family protein, partial [Nitrospirae bacterium]